MGKGGISWEFFSRRTNTKLANLVGDRGIKSYEQLCKVLLNMGVRPPSKNETEGLWSTPAIPITADDQLKEWKALQKKAPAKTKTKRPPGGKKKKPKNESSDLSDKPPVTTTAPGDQLKAWREAQKKKKKVDVQK